VSRSADKLRLDNRKHAHKTISRVENGSLPPRRSGRTRAYVTAATAAPKYGYNPISGAARPTLSTHGECSVCVSPVAHRLMTIHVQPSHTVFLHTAVAWHMWGRSQQNEFRQGQSPPIRFCLGGHQDATELEEPDFRPSLCMLHKPWLAIRGGKMSKLTSCLVLRQATQVRWLCFNIDTITTSRCSREWERRV
jgi:hypothetical protein